MSQKIYILDNTEIQEISKAIAIALTAKSQREVRVHDHRNKTFLGSVLFWLQVRESDNQLILCYDKHPSQWDMDAIKESLEGLERIEWGYDIF